MTHRIAFFSFVLAACALLLGGCTKPSEVREWGPEAVEFTLEGPLFEGPNAGQVALKLDVRSDLGAAENQRVKAARLLHATVRPADTLSFDLVRSFVLSFASDNADVAMQEAAFKNPVPEDAREVSLDVAAQAELGAHFAEDQVYLVLDVDLAEDMWEGSRSFLLDYAMEITLK